MAAGISNISWGVVWTTIALFVLSFFLSIGLAGGETGAFRRIKVQTDTLYVCDTLIVREPVYLTETKTRIEYVPIVDRTGLDSLQVVADSLCAACDLLTLRNDSLMLALQFTQRHYHDSLYDAWVSGYHPSLDSIIVRQQERLVIQRVAEVKPLRWGIGVTGGYGIGKDGLSPFIGVGITYAFTSF